MDQQKLLLSLLKIHDVFLKCKYESVFENDEF